VRSPRTWWRVSLSEPEGHLSARPRFARAPGRWSHHESAPDGQSQPRAGRKAFYNRWPTKGDYIRDCFIHTLLYRDRGGKPLADIAMLQAHLTDTSVPLPVRVRNVAWGIAAGLLNDPRASLFSHAAVMVNTTR